MSFAETASRFASWYCPSDDRALAPRSLSAPSAHLLMPITWTDVTLKCAAERRRAHSPGCR